MKRAYALSLLLWSFSCAGCALVQDGTRNLCAALSTPWAVHREKARNQQWAEAAWQEHCSHPANGRNSEDFADGFKAGYAEFLFRGGAGDPPLIAPRHYRHVRFQTPEGVQAIQDWFNGYRFGAVSARDSGARNWITVPSSLETMFPEAPLAAHGPTGQMLPLIRSPAPDIPAPGPTGTGNAQAKSSDPVADFPRPSRPTFTVVPPETAPEQSQPVAIKIINSYPDGSRPEPSIVPGPRIRIVGVRTAPPEDQGTPPNDR